MITYKGDRFVKGKTFLHENQEYTFITKSKKGYVFESVKDKKSLVLEESVARSLKEVHKCRRVA